MYLRAPLLPLEPEEQQQRRHDDIHEAGRHPHHQAGKLLVLSLVYAIASPLLHHLWFALRGQDDLLQGFLVMFVGDLTGTLIVLYAIKGIAGAVARR